VPRYFSASQITSHILHITNTTRINFA